MYFIFDGSYAGFLTCVFECFERKAWDAVPVTVALHQDSFFSSSETVVTDSAKAQRVLDGLKKRTDSSTLQSFYMVFLSEDPKAWLASFRILIQLFKGASTLLQNYGDPDVLFFTQTIKKVSRERHRMKAFIRFQKSSDGLYYALIEPDFNVLPLIASFFKNRYADQCWLIYDVTRMYGLHYDTVRVQEVTLTHDERTTLSNTAISIALDERDALFQQLWKQYFNSTTIESRRNMKLHLQHVPKRYWKYLVEKQ